MKQKKNLSIEFIQSKVAGAKDLTVETMLARNRKRAHVVARQISMYFSRQYTEHSLQSIGNLHGGLNHATVLHACREIEKKLFVKDSFVVPDFYRIRDEFERSNPEITMERIKRLKAMISNNVPLEIRKRVIEREYA